MISSPLHTCVHCILRITDLSSCLHTCTLWCPRWNVHLNRQSSDWFVTLLHYLFSNKNTLGFWLPNQNYTNILLPEWAAVCHVFLPRQHAVANLVGSWADCPRSWKNAGSGGTLKNPHCEDCLFWYYSSFIQNSIFILNHDYAWHKGPETIITLCLKCLLLYFSLLWNNLIILE